MAGGSAERLTAARLAELRRWAGRLGGDGMPELRAAAGAIARLADELERTRAGRPAGDDSPAPGTGGARTPVFDGERARAWAAEAARAGAVEEVRAAGRAILLLGDELAAARGVLAEASAEPAAASAELTAASASRRRRHPGRRGALLAALPVAAVLAVLAGGRLSAPDLDPSGPAAGALVGSSALESLELSVSAGAGDVRWTLDGEDVSERARVRDDRVVLRPGRLAGGRHVVEASAGSGLPWSGSSHEWAFTVDLVPPRIELPGRVLEAPARLPFVLEGSVERGATLTADGAEVAVAGGRFSLRYPEPPDEPVVLRARDRAGNAVAVSVTVIPVPRLPAAPIRSVHVTAEGWANEELRAGVLRLIDEGRINSVELDLKEESGLVGWDAPVPLARRMGAVQPVYDLREAVELLHARGVRVVGRLVAFRDPVHAEWAWRNRARRQVVQTPGGAPYAGYGGFTNLADADVRDYNVDIAVAAAELGVDDVLYDYVRRPDGPLETMVFPGLEGSLDDAIVAFLAETRERLEPYGTFLGASVFGVAATRPDEVAQPVPAMAREVDYIAPMLYPSHWTPGEYGVADPNAQPYDIVRRSLVDFQRAVQGTGARVVPWLQDFSLGVDYGPREVRAQIRAARELGIEEFLLWDPAVAYTARALDRRARLPATGSAPAEVRRARLPGPEPNERRPG